MSGGGQKFRVAVIGAGAGASHVRGYLANPDGLDLTVVCDLDTERARKAAADAPDCRIESDLDKVVADPEIDVIDICLPPHLHYPVLIKALNAGKHVVCEKPFTTSLKQADTALDLAREKGLTVIPVFQYRYGLGYARLAHLIRKGLTGRAYVATFETHWQRTAAYYDNPWRGTWKGECGGTIISHAIHIHNLMTAILGPVDQVSAFLDTRVNEVETEDCAAIAFRLASGALATSSVTLGAATNTSRIRICFENVTVESGLEPYAVGDGDWTFTAHDPERQAEIDAAVNEVDDAGQRYEGFVSDIYKVLSGETGTIAPTTEDARSSVELVTAIYHSAREGCVVKLPIGPDHQLYEGWMPQQVAAE